MALFTGIGATSTSFQRGLSRNAKFVEWERFDQVPTAIQVASKTGLYLTNFRTFIQWPAI